MARRFIEWWFWLGIALLLSLALFADRAMLVGAIALTCMQIVYVARRRGGMISLAMQVRLSYLAILLVGLWPPLSFIHWIQLVGTWAMVLADYCFLARFLSLLPWNARAKLTVARLVETFLHPPSTFHRGLPE